MKYTIISGFFAIILSVSAMPQSGNSGLQRVLYPLRWVQAAEQCLHDAPADLLRHYIAGDLISAPRAAKLLALCYYTEAGMFVDGRFDMTAIGNSLRSHIGSHELLDKFLDVIGEAAEAGNAMAGDYDLQAAAFHSIMILDKTKKLINSIFRVGSGK